MKASSTPGETELQSDLAVNHEKGNDRRWSMTSSNSKQAASPPPVEEPLMETGKVALTGMRMSSEKTEEKEEDPTSPRLLDADSRAVLVNELTDIDSESDPLLHALAKKPEVRSEDELNALLAATRGVKFFRQMNDASLHLELCRHITHESVDKDHTVFEQGDEGEVFYIIYSGAVKVLVADSRSSPTGMGSPREFGSCVCVLEDGDSFGELALLGNGRRAATIVTAMPTQLLRVEKTAYENSLHRLHQQEQRERVRFLQRVFLFSDWTEDDLSRLAKVVSRKKYEKDGTILVQGTNTDHMYFVASGRCRVLKRMELSSSLHDKLASARGRGQGLHLAEDAAMAASHRPQTSASLSPRSTTKGGGSSMRGGGLAASSRSAVSERGGGGGEGPMLELNEVGIHQYFGERALLDGEHKGTHTASVVAATPVECLLLSK